jgi:hypothetical protein
MVPYKGMLKDSITARCLKKAYTLGYRIQAGEVMNPEGKTLKLQRNSGYPSFKVKDPVTKASIHVRVHWLVALEKFGECVFTPSMHIRHVDDNSGNFSWDNIALGTPRDNSMDRPREKRRSHSCKAASVQRKYDQETVSKIRSDHKTGMGLRKLMRKYGISSSSTVRYILSSPYPTDNTTFGSQALK